MISSYGDSQEHIFKIKFLFFFFFFFDTCKVFPTRFDIICSFQISPSNKRIKGKGNPKDRNQKSESSYIFSLGCESNLDLDSIVHILVESNLNNQILFFFLLEYFHN